MITFTTPKFVATSSNFNLKATVDNLLSQLIYDNKNFTAFDVTSRIRKANPSVQIIHNNVKTLVHNYMASPRPGYRSRVITIGNTMTRATEYYSISTVTNPPVTPVTPVLTQTTTLPNLPIAHVKVFVDQQNRVYISKRQLNKLGLKSSQQYKVTQLNTGYELEFSSTTSFVHPAHAARHISNRGYIRFKNRLASKQYTGTFFGNKISITSATPTPTPVAHKYIMSPTPVSATVVTNTVPSNTTVKVSCIITNAGQVFVNHTELKKLGIGPFKQYKLNSTNTGWVLNFNNSQAYTHIVSNRGTLRFKADRKIQVISGSYNTVTKILYIG
jgi:methionine-rich copper-binding protein CopC